MIDIRHGTECRDRSGRHLIAGKPTLTGMFKMYHYGSQRPAQSTVWPNGKRLGGSNEDPHDIVEVISHPPKSQVFQFRYRNPMLDVD